MSKCNLLGISGKAGSGKDTVGKIIQYLTANEEGKPCFRNKSFEEFIRIPKKGEVNVIFSSSWKVKKFAYKVKQILSLLTGIPIEDFEKEEVKNSYLGEEWNLYKATLKQVTKINETASSFCITKEKAKIKLLDGINIHHPSWDISKIEYKTIKITIRQALQMIGTDLFRDKFHPNTWVNSLFADYKPIEIVPVQAYPTFIEEPIYPNWIITDLRFENEAQAILDRGGILIRINRDKLYFKEGYINRDEYNKVNNITEHPSETALDSYDKFHYVIDNSGTIEELIEKVKEILIKLKII